MRLVVQFNDGEDFKRVAAANDIIRDLAIKTVSGLETLSPTKTFWHVKQGIKSDLWENMIWAI